MNVPAFSPRKVILKALVLFAGMNLLFAAAGESMAIGRLSTYNRLVPGRPRLPYGERPASYNLSLSDLDAMFAAHEISAGGKPAGEFRVAVIGDSSVWGFLLDPQDTLAGQINGLGLGSQDGRQVRAYNLGYPTLSLAKDLLILERALEFEPDLIVWMTTLEAFPKSAQLDAPLVRQNPAAMRELIERFGLDLDPRDSSFASDGFWERTIAGRRRALADVFRLQLYGLMWAATGIDQYLPADPGQRAEDLEPDRGFHGVSEPLQEDDLAFDILAAGIELAGDVPVLIVNQPIFISGGANSDVRYNYYYPIWAYDQYRVLLAEQAEARGWAYLDLWDAVSGGEFTNTALHLSPAGTGEVAALVAGAVGPLAQAGAAGLTAPARIAPASDGMPAEQGQTSAAGNGALPAQPSIFQQALAAPSPVKSGDLDNSSRLPPEQWREWPVVPALSPELVARFRDGITNGLDPRAFSVIGDCQSVPLVFMGVFDQRPEFWPEADYSDLQAALSQFQGSFGRRGAGVANGMGVAAALSSWWADPAQCSPGESPVECELRLHRPAIVFINLGTNFGDVKLHGENLRRLVEATLAHGAVPLLSTKADNAEGDWSINLATARAAYDLDLPLWNFWRLASQLPGGGLLVTGDHGGNYLTREAWNVRSVSGLEVLAALWAQLEPYAAEVASADGGE